jgi:hypothetical protein
VSFATAQFCKHKEPQQHLFAPLFSGSRVANLQLAHEPLPVFFLQSVVNVWLELPSTLNNLLLALAKLMLAADFLDMLSSCLLEVHLSVFY